MTKPKNFWLGIEVEGRLKGLRTLFIEGDKDRLDIELLAKKANVQHLFFGAGFQSRVLDFETIDYFVKKGYLISLDTLKPKLIPEELRDKIHIMYTIKDNDIHYLKPSDTVKIESNDYVRCITESQFIKTKWKEYLKDEQL